MTLLDFFRGKKKRPKPVFRTKRCPECFENLPLSTRRCPACGTRVGRVDHYGKARKGIAWFSYLFCIVSWGAFIFYIHWAFLR